MSVMSKSSPTAAPVAQTTAASSTGIYISSSATKSAHKSGHRGHKAHSTLKSAKHPGKAHKSAKSAKAHKTHKPAKSHKAHATAKPLKHTSTTKHVTHATHKSKSYAKPQHTKSVHKAEHKPLQKPAKHGGRYYKLDNAGNSTNATTTTTSSACALQPVFQTGVSLASGAQAFMADAEINAVAAVAVAPSGFDWIFANFMATVEFQGYLGSTTLVDYDVEICAAKCKNTDKCNSFNLYWQRDPSLLPGFGCADPEPIYSVRCALYSVVFDVETPIDNYGQWETSFAVVVAASNGYALTS